MTNVFRKQKTPIIEANRAATLSEESLVLSEVFGDYARQLRDNGTPQELFRGVTEVETQSVIDASLTGVARFKQSLDFKKKTQDSNILLGVVGFSNIRVGTNIMKAYARRFGMTLEEALASKTVGGKKVYDNAWMVDNMKQATQAIFGYKPGILTSPLLRTLNTIWFPVRFQTKTIMQTADWLGSLHPTTRALVINDWIQMADWMTTKEGQEWKNGNRGLFGNLFNYTFAFEGIGKSVDAVTKGKLFGGNTGLIGGLPFGFISSIARDLGYTSSDSEINQKTGRPFDRTVVRDTLSFSGFVTVVEDILLSMTPSMPFSQATGGEMSTSFRQFSKSLIEDMLSVVSAPFLEGDVSEVKKSIQRGKIKVPLDFQKRFPNPINFLAPERAEASYAPEKEIQKADASTKQVRGVTLSNDDIKVAKAVIFSEVSNRATDKQRLEVKVILNTAINRMLDLRKRGYNVTLAQVLKSSNQYQGYGGIQYKKYMSGDYDVLNERKAKTIDTLTDEVLSKDLKDNTDGSKHYTHNLKTGEIKVKDRGNFPTPFGAVKLSTPIVVKK